MGIVTYLLLLWEFKEVIIVAAGILTILLAIPVSAIRICLEDREYKRTLKGE